MSAANVQVWSKADADWAMHGAPSGLQPASPLCLPWERLLDCGLIDLQDTQSASEHPAVLTSSSSSSALTQAGCRSNQVSFIQQPGGWCLGSRGPASAMLPWSVPGTVQHPGELWWSMPPLSVSSLVGPAWPGFPSEVWNQGWEAGLSGSTSWLLHSLPARMPTHTHTPTHARTHTQRTINALQTNMCSIQNHLGLLLSLA